MCEALPSATFSWQSSGCQRGVGTPAHLRMMITMMQMMQMMMTTMQKARIPGLQMFSLEA